LINAKERGRIEEGTPADLVVFDKDFAVQEVYLKGEKK
jgi:N-acetylglucosamine-6-phosphate deacetylase